MKKYLTLLSLLSIVFHSCVTITDICELDKNSINSQNCKLRSYFCSLNSQSYDKSDEFLTYMFFMEIDTNIHWYPEIIINNIIIVNKTKSEIDTLNITKIYYVGSESENYLINSNIDLSEINFTNLFYRMQDEYKFIWILFETNRKVKEVEKLFVDLNFIFNGKQYEIKGIKYKKCKETWSPFHMVFRENGIIK